MIFAAFLLLPAGCSRAGKVCRYTKICKPLKYMPIDYRINHTIINQVMGESDFIAVGSLIGAVGYKESLKKGIEFSEKYPEIFIKIARENKLKNLSFEEVEFVDNFSTIANNFYRKISKPSRSSFINRFYENRTRFIEINMVEDSDYVLLTWTEKSKDGKRQLVMSKRVNTKSIALTTMGVATTIGIYGPFVGKNE